MSYEAGRPSADAIEDDARSEAALEELLERLRPRLRSLLARYRIPAQDAEDLLQQALLALVHRWNGSIRNPEAWLLGTLRKTCLLYWRARRRSRLQAMDAAALEWIATPDPPAQDRGALRRDLSSLMAQLPARCQLVLRLRYQLGLGDAEMAALLGYRSSSIGKITARCLESLARLMSAS